MHKYLLLALFCTLRAGEFTRLPEELKLRVIKLLDVKSLVAWSNIDTPTRIFVQDFVKSRDGMRYLDNRKDELALLYRARLAVGERYFPPEWLCRRGERECEVMLDKVSVAVLLGCLVGTIEYSRHQEDPRPLQAAGAATVATFMAAGLYCFPTMVSGQPFLAGVWASRLKTYFNTLNQERVSALVTRVQDR